jgi:hypothetical protein
MKSYADCKKEVAKKYGFGNLVMGHLVKYYDEAAEMYAKECVANSSKAISLEQIKNLFAAGFKYFLLWLEQKQKAV